MKGFYSAIVLGVTVLSVFALSVTIDRDINFPKDYDSKKAEALRKVIRDTQFNFVGGLVSYWPPDWGTRLSYEGNAGSLNAFIAQLHQLPGLSFRLKLYQGRDDERRRDSSWQLDFSQAHPNELTLYLNLNSKNLKFDELNFPVWPDQGK
jgi:hypothetical protein